SQKPISPRLAAVSGFQSNDLICSCICRPELRPDAADPQAWAGNFSDKLGRSESLPGFDDTSLRRDQRVAKALAQNGAPWLEVRRVDNMALPDDGLYSGEASQNGQPHGQGVQSWIDGTEYKGSWVDGTAHGEGKLVKSDGSGYEGQWADGRKQGEGYEWLPDAEYRGQFADGQKHGSGHSKWKDDSSYIGSFFE
ncbi:unnamed protein product, partial [Polarella glacialis]